MNTNKNNIVKYTIFIALSGFFLFVDLLTKFIAQVTLEGKKPLVLIDGVLELLFIRNEGAAWGMFSGAGINIFHNCHSSHDYYDIRIG